MFQSVAASANFPRLEEEVLRFWKERGIYDKSLERRRGAPSFVFYEGPPTANGMPHPGHCLTRAIKDLFPRYRTMRGYLCERKAGWDTHGLPVEVEVCKELGIHAKDEIEAFGVEPFIHKCQESVWRYMKEWERLTERIGFWIKLDEAYVTYHQSYVESVWWSLKNLFDRGLLYQGHKIVWWWAQGGTALSSGEVGQGYREVADPSVFVRFPLVDDQGKDTNTSLLVWTTTPWTLPSNQFAAVNEKLDYVAFSWYTERANPESRHYFIVAKDCFERVKSLIKAEIEVEQVVKGADLVGRWYRPPFSYFASLPLDQLYLRIGPDEASNRPNWRVVTADFVSTDTGTGIVHIAPAYGEDDYNVLLREQAKIDQGYMPRLLNPVLANGTFTYPITDYEGRWVKDCDKDIIRYLDDKFLLFSKRGDQYIHQYPFCWRADEDPLIQYPRKSWFIRTTQFKDEMLANNEQINWLPEHIKHGRFGNFLESNVDWALSRERFWGTPLPVWVCQQTGQMEAIGSYTELLAKPGVQGTEVWTEAKNKNPQLNEDLKVHKPYIDAITYDSPFAPGARMQRVSEVIDCWYDSGAMPFAQWGYPHQNAEKFLPHFPADFISEAIDQTRGWFYSQLAISTMMFGRNGDQGPGARDQEREPGTGNGEPGGQERAVGLVPTDFPAIDYPHPYKNCIVLGLMLAEWWENKSDSRQIFLSEAEAAQKIGAANVVKRVGKMSKQKRNYREPSQIFDNYGADALRWYFFANQAPWNSILYSERAIKESIPEFLLRLWNVYSFFVIYANIDGFDPAASLHGHVNQLTARDLSHGKGYRPVSERSELDRWVLSELNRTLAAVVDRMDHYDNFEACKRINEFVDGLSNWYVRRSRDRFWASEKHSADKLDAYWTLYECLITSAKMVAPFVPFLAETLWQNLAGTALESVHLCDYPTGNAEIVNDILSSRMRTLREIASLGRSARMDNKLKVRQPLSSVHVILSDATHQQWLEEHDALLRDELNVKQIDYIREAEKYITYQVQPNFKRLGPRVGKLLPGLKAALGQANGAQLLAELSAAGKVTLEVSGERVELDSEDIQVRLQAKPGWAAAQGAGVVVVLNTELTPELIAEGYARDVVRLVQDRRKEMNLDFTDRIELGLTTASDELKQAIQANADYIAGETLATSLKTETLADGDGQEVEIGDFQATLFVRRLR